MILRGLAIFAVLLAIMQTPVPVRGQATKHSAVNQQNSPLSAPSNTLSPGVGGPTGRTDCNGAPCEEQQPRVIVSVPAPATAPWTTHDRIAWAASLVLVILGYVGILLAVSTLKKIERQTRSLEAVASAAADNAQAALLNAQAAAAFERPWLLITVEPSLNIENGFNVMVTNRGRTPARIVATAEQLTFAIDESYLPETPEYQREEVAGPSPSPIILVPGESAAIRKFCRNDVKGLCESPERFKRIEDWEEKLFIYGKVVYRDLIASLDKPAHETAWCCWYIHGRQNSGLVIAGPPGYNAHS
jgi:antitoxin (DNA-binding transcriptional repressor) of toxin-antitoxin stability system